MTRGFQKFVLTVHVSCSLGWFGAVAAFLALAIAGLTSQDALIVRAAYPALQLIVWFVIIPLSFISLLTGIVQSLGTRWGLFRNYWVLIKLLLVIFSIMILLVHIQPISYMADLASEKSVTGADIRAVQIQLVVAPIVALLVFLVNATLAVYKPKGMTRRGQRKQQERHMASPV